MPFKKTGEWGRIDKIIRNLRRNISHANQTSLKQVGLKMERIAVKHMQRQDLGWQPLKQKTLESKIRKGQSNKMLIATSEYFQAITSFTKGNVAFAGVTRNAKNRKGDALVSIARVHEFGNQNTPARPLWRPTWNETLMWLKTTKLIRKNAITAIRRG